MLIIDLLEDLQSLKRDIVTAIKRVESVHDEHIDTAINKHVAECRTHLALICEMVQGSLYPLKKKNNNGSQNKQDHQSMVDDLDDLDFDEFLQDTPIAAPGGNSSSTSALKHQVLFPCLLRSSSW